MRRRFPHPGLILLLLVLAAAALWSCRQRPLYHFGGGPTGSTLHHFAAGLVSLINQTDLSHRLVLNRSGGSLANLTEVNEGNLDMALVYAGDAALGSLGRLDHNLPPTSQVRALARLYGAPAQLAVLQRSAIHSPGELSRRRVAIGNPGSGSALAAERYFRSLGLWEEIIPVYLGTVMALEDLDKGAVEAVWEQSGVPSAPLQDFARRSGLRLLDLQAGAMASGLFEHYPFYTASYIPAGTYRGLDRDVATFQDAALWVAHERVSAEFVAKALALVFSAAGQKQLRQADPVAKNLSLDFGLYGVDIPLHPGALGFWQQQGIALPPPPKDH
jgi:TRAP transporter TAXI family solute receptor